MGTKYVNIRMLKNAFEALFLVYLPVKKFQITQTSGKVDNLNSSIQRM